ncbi:type VI secretion system baseplate subunit TssE [Ningiella sp. W23]|uniref:type VI secretion system baseplate subunit TssE n=1 Tax=Ningiella sp. W23 TaxID=3023715 RepID=UPI0037563A83
MQRVRLGADGEKHSVEFDYDAYKASVFHHLQDMFNVRQGSSLSNPDYGLPDFNDLDMKHGFSVAVKEIIKAIKENIEKHESGLSRVRVKFLKDDTAPLDLRFEIVGVLVVGKRSERIRFETRKCSSGYLEVL